MTYEGIDMAFGGLIAQINSDLKQPRFKGMTSLGFDNTGNDSSDESEKPAESE